jgi:circadian clock protein KaiB
MKQPTSQPAGGGEPDGGSHRYVLRLYVAGAASRSKEAIANIRAICEQHLPDDYDLQVIDLYQEPVLASEQQVIAAPTLVKELPLPLRRLIGDMSDPAIVLVGLDLLPEEEQPSGAARSSSRASRRRSCPSSAGGCVSSRTRSTRSAAGRSTRSSSASPASRASTRSRRPTVPTGRWSSR